MNASNENKFPKGSLGWAKLIWDGIPKQHDGRPEAIEIMRALRDAYLSGRLAAGQKTFRDEVALIAFNRMMHWDAAEGCDYEEIAEHAFKAADAFLKVRNEKED